MLVVSIVWNCWSWLVGLVDQSFQIVRILARRSELARRSLFFSKGYGDIAAIEHHRDETMKALETNTYKRTLTDQDIHFQPILNDGNVTIQEGSFVSPLAHLLPPEARHCHFRIVRPTKSQKQKVYVIMLPATGEMGKSPRLETATALAKTHGWSSVILTAAFYGRRKPTSQHAFFLDTVAKILIQAQSIFEEAALLSRYFLKQNAHVCFTGFSFGGSMAMISTAFSLLTGGDGTRLACASYVGSASPNVLADGVLEASLDLQALQDNDEEEPVTRRKLYEFFNKTQLTLTTDAFQKRPMHKMAAVVKLVNGKHDAFVRPRYARELAAQANTLSTNVDFQWMSGGHVSAAVTRRIYQKQLIVETVQELLSRS